MPELAVSETSIPGLLKIKLIVNEDERGSFTELYQAEKLQALGLPEFNVVQTNLSTNRLRGVTRGIHAEPWNKYVTPLRGRVFVAVVDLRKANFGKVETFEPQLGEGIFIPKGCANSYQTLSDEAYYLYHVDAHWQPGTSYPSIYPFDKQLDIKWPIAEAAAILSDKDKANPPLSEVSPL